MKIIKPKDLKLENLTKEQLIEMINENIYYSKQNDFNRMIQRAYYNVMYKQVYSKERELSSKASDALNELNMPKFKKILEEQRKVERIHSKLVDMYLLHKRK